MARVLICDDDLSFHLVVKHGLKGKYDAVSAHNGDEALAIVRNHPIDVVLLDVQMRQPDEGLRLIPRLREADGDLAIVMSSGVTDFHTVREAMRLGAVDYVPKEFDPDGLLHVIARVLERQGLVKRGQQQNFEALSQQKQHALIGESPAMHSLRKTIEKLKLSGANVVITGETGTGKEVVARQFRRTLPDGSLAPFAAVDSSTIQGSTAESFLFGHEKGAFTGAEQTRKGIFEEANGGIVYFDEIANMGLEIQSKLLRALQEKEVVRLGSSKVISLDFRVVCATNRNLEEMARAGGFKADLLQRLNVLPIQIPSLRDRAEDIPLLAAHFARKHPGAGGSLAFSAEALEAMKAYPWPGNVRELQNVVSYLAAMAEDTEIGPAELPPRIRDGASQGPALLAAAEPGEAGFYERVAAFEKQLLAGELSRAGGNVSRLAVALGMDRSHLYTKLRQYGIHGRKDKDRDEPGRGDD